MRIIAGSWRGRSIVSPKGDDTRPTSDRTREALFSMLASRFGSFEGVRVLDLFAGTGALGLEALSRGAAYATFVERERQALDVLKVNVAKLAAPGTTDIRGQGVEALGPLYGSRYDLVLIDPPYLSGGGGALLERLARLGWFAPGALVSVETGKAEVVAAKGFEQDTDRVHGKAKLTLLRWVGGDEAPVAAKVEAVDEEDAVEDEAED
ncbi:16S rRNA (guanine(966)-N(2))-methyltransferase RsmD [Sphingomonas prati]|uniref:16S rRNA (Guanine966-N2)-methyltransferase n=1 Tax=Sphingomonas prati TaxID=1843237 RepID=A0A7W9BQQ0_9SPHN|nr:16S rRNA (guanine(966)-N(2))-methyltransferase RsmD [Sphingomonas prati]MBB5728406.1 16S rRNA (guanine966-N2)-methyltransferase [Sphingomonas prati]GGE74038.1 methyltransferase [Sphingomonas prati]